MRAVCIKRGYISISIHISKHIKRYFQLDVLCVILLCVFFDRIGSDMMTLAIGSGATLPLPVLHLFALRPGCSLPRRRPLGGRDTAGWCSVGSAASGTSWQAPGSRRRTLRNSAQSWPVRCCLGRVTQRSGSCGFSRRSSSARNGSHGSSNGCAMSGHLAVQRYGLGLTCVP